MNRASKKALTLLEVLTAAVIATLMALPIISLLATGSHESMVSEDYMFAQALAQRYLAEAMATSLEVLEEKLPLEKELSGLPEDDEKIAALFEEYRKNLSGSQAFAGELKVSEIAPRLLKYEVSLSWPVKPGSSKLRKYVLLRLRCHRDISISSNFRLAKYEEKEDE